MSEFTIVELEDLADGVTLFEVRAPRLAERHRAGQFAMIRPHEKSEQLPVTVAWADREAGTVTLVVQSVGRTTLEMCRDFRRGDSFASVTGPLGNPARIEIPGKPAEFRGTVVCVAGGIGAAPIVPIARAFRDAGHEVITILSARHHDLLILNELVGAFSKDLIHVTDDGSFGRKGPVADVLKALVESRRGEGKGVDLVVAIGPPLTMQGCARAVEPLGVPTVVSLNTIMVEGTGMCGGCRVMVGGEAKYVCVDGPDFDGCQVDFGAMIRRQEEVRAGENGLPVSSPVACADDSCRALATAPGLE